jgi:poly-gamma-glutamate capsule biosynthesis protein CapA/YwtB (metallophosphatase superfamily)
MTSVRIRHFKVNRASRSDAAWLRNVLNREGERFKTSVEFVREDSLTLKWD